MNVEIKIDSNCDETKVIILTNKMNDEVNEIIKKLSDESLKILAGTKDDRLEVLEQASIVRVYSADKKVFAVTNNGEYIVRMRLYEVEDRLDKEKFVKISNSEIINIKKVKNFDLNLVGTICVSMLDGTVTFVSRRYVSKIKQLLGIGGR